MGYPQPKGHEKIVLGEVLLSPAKSINTSNTTRVSPSKLLSTTQQSISLPTEYCFPARPLEYLFSPQSNPFAKFIPQRSHLLLPVFLQLSSPAEAINQYFNISPGVTSRHPSRIYFPRRKHTFQNITFSYIIACIYASYLKSHLCGEHHCLIYIMYCI